MEEEQFLAGRIEKKLSKKAQEFLVKEDIEWDSRLIGEEILGSKAHTVMLWKTGIISRDEAKKILEALEKAKALWLDGKFKLKPEFEDVHLNIENFVIGEAGVEVGGKLHTARSRNEQIILDLRLYLRKEVNSIAEKLIKLIKTFLGLAEKHVETVMPGYTHLQHAQPITFAHWLLAYTEMFFRDLERLEKAYSLINLNPLGAGAIAGTSWPINRKLTTNLLGFDDIQKNSLDVVSSRGEDLAELLFSFSVLMVHLSRLATDLMVWSTYEFRMVEFDDSYAMASSIMPQKKNPDVSELLRGKASTVTCQLLNTLELLRGLPSGYNKDPQESKPYAFKAVENVKLSLEVVDGLISTLKVNRQRMFELANLNFSTATDLADLIVKKTGIPFRVSYQIVGKLVKNVLGKGGKTTDVKVEDLKKASLEVLGKEIVIPEKELKKVLNPLTSIKMKRSEGSPNPKQTLKTIKENLERVRVEEKKLKLRMEKIRMAEEKLQLMVEEILKQN